MLPTLERQTEIELGGRQHKVLLPDRSCLVSSGSFSQHCLSYALFAPRVKSLRTLQSWPLPLAAVLPPDYATVSL